MEALSFKQAVSNDISAVFLNQDEFADPHTIDGQPMTGHPRKAGADLRFRC